MNLFSALYLNELVYYLIKPLVPEYALYTSYVLTLHRLAQAENRSSIEALLRRFEWALLGACGQQFSLVHEAGKPNLIEAHYYYRLIPGQGMVRAERGIPGSDVLAIAADDLTQPDYLRSAKILMRQAIEPLLDGQEIKARSILAALIKKEVSNQSLE
jgi:DNA repair protein RecO (recombination protein O)